MIKNVENAGISYVELLDEGLHVLTAKRIRVLNDLASSYNLVYSLHAPFIGVDISISSDWLWRAMTKGLKKSVLHAEALNCHVWVFHPGTKWIINGFRPGLDWVRTLETSRLLFKFAGDHGVSAVIENLPEPQRYLLKNVEDFKRFYAEIDEDIELALDIGHANTVGQVENFICTFRDRIGHIHAHDNDGKRDLHLGVGFGTVDWKKTADALKRISYGKTVAVESTENVRESAEKLGNLLG